MGETRSVNPNCDLCDGEGWVWEDDEGGSFDCPCMDGCDCEWGTCPDQAECELCQEEAESALNEAERLGYAALTRIVDEWCDGLWAFISYPDRKVLLDRIRAADSGSQDGPR